MPFNESSTVDIGRRCSNINSQMIELNLNWTSNLLLDLLSIYHNDKQREVICLLWLNIKQVLDHNCICVVSKIVYNVNEKTTFIMKWGKEASVWVFELELNNCGRSRVALWYVQAIICYRRCLNVVCLWVEFEIDCFTVPLNRYDRANDDLPDLFWGRWTLTTNVGQTIQIIYQSKSISTIFSRLSSSNKTEPNRWFSINYLVLYT